MNNQNDTNQKTSLLLSPEQYTFTDAIAGSSVTFAIKTKDDVKLLSVNVSCGCLKPKIENNVANITFNIPNTKGSQFIRNLKVFTDKGEVDVRIKGNVKSNA